MMIKELLKSFGVGLLSVGVAILLITLMVKVEIIAMIIIGTVGILFIALLMTLLGMITIDLYIDIKHDIKRRR